MEDAANETTAAAAGEVAAAVDQATSDTLAVSVLSERAEAVARDLFMRHLATEPELDALRPGGADNPATGGEGTLKFFERVVRIHASRLTPADERPDAKAIGASLDQALAEALSEEPEGVTLSSGDVEQVYPKSYHALRWLDSLDAEQRAHAMERGLAEKLATITDVDVLTLAPLAESLAVRLWAWILTSEGPGLPFDEREGDLEPPAFTLRLTPEDLLRLYQAHHRVNAARLQIIANAFPSDTTGGKSKLTLAGFLGTVASEGDLSRVRGVMKRTSLGAIFAARVAAAQSAREAHETAKKTAATRGA